MRLPRETDTMHDGFVPVAGLKMRTSETRGLMRKPRPVCVCVCASALVVGGVHPAQDTATPRPRHFRTPSQHGNHSPKHTPPSAPSPWPAIAFFAGPNACSRKCNARCSLSRRAPAANLRPCATPYAPPAWTHLNPSRSANSVRCANSTAEHSNCTLYCRSAPAARKRSSDKPTALKERSGLRALVVVRGLYALPHRRAATLG